MTLGANDLGKDAVRRTLRGGGSGRVLVFVIGAVFLAVGICLGNLLIAVPFGIVTVAATASLARSWRHDRAARRLARSSSLTDR